MDTHITSDPALGMKEPLRSARLPGEPELVSLTGAEDPALHAGPRPASPPPARAWRRRRGLLAGVAIAAVLATGMGAFLVSPLNRVVPIPREVTSTVHQLASGAGLAPERPVAPSAALAAVQVPPQPGTIVQPKYAPAPPGDEMAELLRLHPGAPRYPLPVPSPSPVGGLSGGSGDQHRMGPPAPSQAAQEVPRPDEPHEPGMPLEGPPKAVTGTAAAFPPTAVLPASRPASLGPANGPSLGSGKAEGDETPPQGSAASGGAKQAVVGTEPLAPAPPAFVAAAPASPASKAIAPSGPNALAIAAQIHAAPMAPLDQVQVLELVTQIAAMVRDQRTATAELRADIARVSAGTTAQLSDFERRLALAEARNAVVAAAGAGGDIALASPEIPAARSQPSTAPIAVTPAAAALAGTPSGTLKRYHLQAASPGLAMLTEIDRGGGEGAQLQVQVGDTIPGYGKVKSVSQHGTSWVVTTDNGTIQ